MHNSRPTTRSAFCVQIRSEKCPRPKAHWQWALPLVNNLCRLEHYLSMRCPITVDRAPRGVGSRRPKILNGRTRLDPLYKFFKGRTEGRCSRQRAVPKRAPRSKGDEGKADPEGSSKKVAACRPQPPPPFVAGAGRQPRPPSDSRARSQRATSRGKVSSLSQCSTAKRPSKQDDAHEVGHWSSSRCRKAQRRVL
jgi:hypothetical protein